MIREILFTDSSLMVQNILLHTAAALEVKQLRGKHIK